MIWLIVPLIYRLPISRLGAFVYEIPVRVIMQAGRVATLFTD